MKALLPISALLFLTACSSGPVSDSKSTSADTSNVTKESFSKEKPLVPSEVRDFYVEQPKSLTPALQDETLDRYSADELEILADNKDPLVEIAIRCSKRDFKNAFATAAQAFNRYQKIPVYWNLVANCHLNQGSHRKALLFYNKALEVSPNYVPALNNIGVLYTRQGEDQKALVAFERANKQSRFAKTPRYNLARLYLSYGIAEQALPLFQGLLNEAPNDVDLLNAVASCHYILGNYAEAASHYERIPGQLFERAEIGLNYAVTLNKLGRNGDAHKIFENIDKPKSQGLKEYYSLISSKLGVK